jgi:hypothetical protein
MKTVFKSDEIAHIWANRGASYGRSPGNLSFDGAAIKSYATVIGRRIEHKGKTAFVIDGASFSNSTSKSQGRIRQAIPGSAKVFTVDCGSRGQSLNFTPATLRDHYLERAKAAESALPSRYARIRAEQYQHVTSLLGRALEVCEFFGLGALQLSRQIANRQAGQSEAAETLRVARVKQLAAQSAKAAREVKERTARNIAEAEKFLADDRPSTRWLDTLEPHRAAAFAMLPADLQTRVAAKVNASNASLVTRWLAGKPVELPRDCPTMLRADGAEMVTSHGARVPLEDARRTYRFAMRAKSKGWHRNGETHAIGSYQLDSVNEQGVIAGCHRVTWAEIERFAAAQKWSA